MPPCIIRYWLTGYIRHLWGSAWARNPRKEMPADPIEGLQWIVPKLLKDLTEAKMWPIKMMQVKHQETLRDSHAPNCGIIHFFIYISLSHIILKYTIYVSPKVIFVFQGYGVLLDLRWHVACAVQGSGDHLFRDETLSGPVQRGQLGWAGLGYEFSSLSM